MLMAETGSRDFDIGGVRINVEYRPFGGDSGPTVHVYGDVDGRSVELLRFDCYENDPHYHSAPEVITEEHQKLNPREVPDPVAWTLAQLSHNLVSMIRTAGDETVADRIDQKAVAGAIPRVEAALREVCRTA
jgi:hypothetical protein